MLPRVVLSAFLMACVAQPALAKVKVSRKLTAAIEEQAKEKLTNPRHAKFTYDRTKTDGDKVAVCGTVISKHESGSTPVTNVFYVVGQDDKIVHFEFSAGGIGIDNPFLDKVCGELAKN